MTITEFIKHIESESLTVHALRAEVAALKEEQQRALDELEGAHQDFKEVDLECADLKRANHALQDILTGYKQHVKYLEHQNSILEQEAYSLRAIIKALREELEATQKPCSKRGRW